MITQILLMTIMPSVATGIVLLILEYLTPWFARSLQQDTASITPPAVGQPEGLDRNSFSTLVRQLSDRYGLNLVHYEEDWDGNRTGRVLGVDSAKVLIWKLDRLGQSHLHVVVEVFNEYGSTYFDLACTPEGEIGEAHRLAQLPQEPNPKPKGLALTSPLSVVLISIIWMLSTGITVGILWGTGNLAVMYQERGLDLYRDSLLLTILIVVQTAALTPILFTFLAHTLQKLGAHVMAIAVGGASLMLWLLGTLLLGVYPPVVMALVDSQVPKRLDFQRLFVRYRASAASSVVWGADVTLVIILSGLVLGLAILVGRSVIFALEHEKLIEVFGPPVIAMGLYALITSYPHSILSWIVCIVVAGVVLLWLLFFIIGLLSLIISSVTDRLRK